MRDYFVALVVFGSLPLILLRPHYGIIMWCWVSYMNPHRMTWSFAYSLPVAMAIGAVTILAWFLSQEDNKKIPWNAVSVLMLILILWTGVTTIFAYDPAVAFKEWSQFAKIILMTFVTIALMHTRERLRALVWVIVLSIGFFSVKGGIFTVLTGGQYLVWGPPDSFIQDNNALALATLMIIPLMFYLASVHQQRWIKWGMYGGAVCSAISVVGSYSRGAFVGLIALAFVMWWRSRYKIVLGVLAFVALSTAVAVAPEQWISRMETIERYEEDASASERLAVWGMAIRVANERPIVGGGLGVFWHQPTFDRLQGDLTRIRNAHSIYFEMLATQGYVGLAIFLALGIAGLMGAGRIRKLTAGKPEFAEEYKLATMLQYSLIAYAVSGTFQNLSMYDLYYHLLAMVVIAQHLVSKATVTDTKVAVPSPASSPGQGLVASTGRAVGQVSFRRLKSG